MEKNAKIRLIFSIFLGVFTVAVGILFLAEAADIYFSGVAQTGVDRGMYSRALVGERLGALILPVCLWLVAIVESVVVYALFPVAPARKGGLAQEKIYARLNRRISSEKDPSAYARLRRAGRVRLGVRIFTAAFCLAAAVMCIVYLADGSHFTSFALLNSEVLAMVRNVLPWAGAALLLLIFEAVFEGLYVKKYLPVVKGLVGSVYVPSKWENAAKKVSAAAGNQYAVLGVRIALLVLAVTFIVLGAVNGGAGDVFIKAINICTECIGLG